MAGSDKQAELDPRFQRVVKRLLETPPKPHKPKAAPAKERHPKKQTPEK